MSELVRFGVSMDRELVESLDRIVEIDHYPNRSEAIRGLVRQELLRHGEIDPQCDVIAIVQLIFHYSVSISRNPIDRYPSLRIITNLQQHIQKEICMKILVVSGKYDEVRSWAHELSNQRQVIGNVTIAATDNLVKELIE